MLIKKNGICFYFDFNDMYSLVYIFWADDIHLLSK